MKISSGSDRMKNFLPRVAVVLESFNGLDELCVGTELLFHWYCSRLTTDEQRELRSDSVTLSLL